MKFKVYSLRSEKAGVPMNKGNETGDILKDGYRVKARACDDYNRERRRMPGRDQTSHTFSNEDE